MAKVMKWLPTVLSVFGFSCIVYVGAAAVNGSRSKGGNKGLFWTGIASYIVGTALRVFNALKENQYI